jgi:hypothetical protein
MVQNNHFSHHRRHVNGATYVIFLFFLELGAFLAYRERQTYDLGRQPGRQRSVQARMLTYTISFISILVQKKSFTLKKFYQPWYLRFFGSLDQLHKLDFLKIRLFAQASPRHLVEDKFCLHGPTLSSLQ